MQYFTYSISSSVHIENGTSSPILGNPGATSRDDAIFSGERYFRRENSRAENIAFSRLVALGSPLQATFEVR